MGNAGTQLAAAVENASIGHPQCGIAMDGTQKPRASVTLLPAFR